MGWIMFMRFPVRVNCSLPLFSLTNQRQLKHKNTINLHMSKSGKEMTQLGHTVRRHSVSMDQTFGDYESFKTYNTMAEL